MVTTRPGVDRKEQIVSSAIDRLAAVGFEGFRVGDVAKDVGINNATLIHHYPSKVALIKAVVERFTQKFEAVADTANTKGTAKVKLARHMRSSVELMRTSPEMFVVLNEIMIKGRRDAEISRLVSVPLIAWRHHIVSLLLSPLDESNIVRRRRAEEIATSCMAQLLGLGLLLSSSDHPDSPFAPSRDHAASHAIVALTNLVEEVL
jgi:TetR/AcrR family transcriptional repressor of nem operon